MNALGYIICETASAEPMPIKVVSESSKGVPTIEAILQDMDVVNRNKRYYAREDLAPQLKHPRILELLASGNLFGEAGHPTSKDLSRQQTIDPTNMSHLINKLWVDGNDIRGHVTPANTAVGDDFRRIIDGGTYPSFSLRALGSIKNTRRGAEVKNIRIITWDWVVYPSHVRAYMQNLVSIAESAVTGESNNLFLEQNDAGLFVPVNNQQVIDYIKESSGNIKMVQESLEFMYESFIINEGGKSVTLKADDGAIINIRLEEYISNEIMNYVTK